MAADPRVVSLLAWAVVLLWFGRVAVTDRHQSDLALALLALLAAAPVWPVVWYTAWTEPVSIALFAAAVVLWRRRPSWGDVALGLGLASKQYFVFLAPLLLLHPEMRRPKRLVTVLGVAAATVLPFAVINPQALWDATVGNIAGIGFRPDTQSLSGLLAAVDVDWVLPAWAWLLGSFSVAVALARRFRSEGEFLLRATLVLGFAFLTGLAFPNYWFLLAGLGALGVLTPKDARVESVATYS